MNTFQLECFLAVAETLNFGRAAAKLNVTQPAITHQIHTLESELNVRLFRRTTHTVEITREGYLFLEDARTITAVSERAKKRFENFRGQEHQLFSIGYHNDGRPLELPEILQKFSQMYPTIHPVLRGVPSQPLLYRLLEDENADVIWSIGESNSGKTPGIYKEITKSPLVCACHQNHKLTERSHVTLADLNKERLILFHPTNSIFSIAKFQGQMLQGRNPAEIYFCESLDAALTLVKAGYGVFLLPRLLLPPDQSLNAVPVKDCDPIPFGVCYRTLQHNKPLKSFVDLVKEHFSGEYAEEPAEESCEN